MRELLIATGNEGKFIEIREALQDLPFRFVSLKGIVSGEEVEETGSTLEENAALKAKTYGDRTGMLALSDDSGLFVDALDGAPGVHSGRYAPTREERIKKLLLALGNVPEGRRGARFSSVMALYDPALKKLKTCEGTAIGHILTEAKGTGGFGYDPIFFYDEAGKEGGEMSVEEKNRFSHRAKALQKIRDILLAEFA